jgi:hypothetical protein
LQNKLRSFLFVDVRVAILPSQIAPIWAILMPPVMFWPSVDHQKPTPQEPGQAKSLSGAAEKMEIWITLGLGFFG